MIWHRVDPFESKFLLLLCGYRYICEDMKPFYDNFLAALEERYPAKCELVNALVEMLCLERESVYRRLRRDVYFSADEMMQIAGAWNISLDNIVSANRAKTHSFHLKTIDFASPTDEDYAILEQHNRDLELVAADPQGRAIEIVNALPRGLYARSELLTRFFTMKWRHKFSPETALAFGEIEISERMRAIDRDYVHIEHTIPEMYSIHDPRMIEYLVGEITYYRMIGMLTESEAGLLRGELAALIDYMERVTLTGYFPDTKCKHFFYLSHTWIETEYLLFRSRGFNMGMVRVLERNAVSTFDERILDRFFEMARATMRMSVLMSRSNALQQAEYFARQREIIAVL